MKNTIQTIACMMLILLAASCKKIIGDGPTTTETRHLTGFTSITSSVDATVIFKQGSDYEVKINAQQNILDRMKSDVRGGDLRFYYQEAINIGRHDPITIYITAPAVYSFTLNGSGDIRSSDIQAGNRDVRLQTVGSGEMYFPSIKSTSIDASISGSGKINIAGGEVINARYDISGSGSIDANRLVADDVTTHTSGSGTMRIYANRDLDVHISGSGNVYYRGNPHISTSISGSGTVRPYQ